MTPSSSEALELSESPDLLTLREASDWASSFLQRSVSTSNISYLVQYGRISKHRVAGRTRISQLDLQKYYEEQRLQRKSSWKDRLGDDLNWHLSFDQLREIHTTKHVHRLHPYKGKFIPQLVEYFLDAHTDEFKKEVIFQPGDIVLDPFCGSGTTLVQANELGLHAIGIDVSAFNTLLSNVKVHDCDLQSLERHVQAISNSLESSPEHQSIKVFEQALLRELSRFNAEYFPTPEFKQQVHRGEIDEREFGQQRVDEFLPVYVDFLRKHNIQLNKSEAEGFLESWYIPSILTEIRRASKQIVLVNDQSLRNILFLFLSRTIRSARATTHSDLATLHEPQTATYYCTKHKKICKPLFSIVDMWKKYSSDGMQRLATFQELRTDTEQVCITADSRSVDLPSKVGNTNPTLGRLLRDKQIRGIFSSPPYVGLIDYHEQHAYAYELLGLPRTDDLEIGPMFRGQGREARSSYVEDIAAVLRNSRQWMRKEFDVLLVANDKHDLYPPIAEKAGMKIVAKFKRPVLNRAEDKGAYAETIFHLRSA